MNSTEYLLSPLILNSLLHGMLLPYLRILDYTHAPISQPRFLSIFRRKRRFKRNALSGLP
jgi:hypothetical protein